MSKDLDSDQDQHFGGLDLGPNCCKSYQQMGKVVASKERVNGYRTYVLLVNHYSIALAFVTRHLI